LAESNPIATSAIVALLHQYGAMSAGCAVPKTLRFSVFAGLSKPPYVTETTDFPKDLGKSAQKSAQSPPITFTSIWYCPVANRPGATGCRCDVQRSNIQNGDPKIGPAIRAEPAEQMVAAVVAVDPGPPDFDAPA